MPITAKNNYSDRPHPFPRLASDEDGSVWLLTHNLEVGLVKILIAPCDSAIKSGWMVGDYSVIEDDADLTLYKTINHSITLRNN